ncbi:Putative HLH DNA-binding domain superfamily protein [Zea mays]|uniref:Putative HLH DNA-binding domain superfamily protein n=1 Tax=Zea mays TaxID=4577 RepID=A0A1D6FGD1_MAIZE|nr:Putative HLH DNA-binding domain superfamily protein [Zea mays]
MDMDSGSWLHGYATTNASGNNGFMCGYAAGSSCSPAEQQQCMEDEQQQFLISMRMNMDDEAAVVYHMSSNGGATAIDMHDPIVDGLLDDPHHGAGGRACSSFPSSSSCSSLSLPAASASLSCSPDDPDSSSAHHILAAPAAGGGNQQYPEVSSHVPLLPPPPPPPVVPSYDHHHQYTDLHAPAPAKPTGAFKHYARHLGPKRPPKPGACGQRMFKTAMSVLSKMHVAARYSQQQYYYQAAAAAEAAQPPPSVNQLQHMFSERKRREKLNDSFHALKAALPPGAKKDKTSILIRARDYVRSLEAKVAELEEKNKSLESRLTRRTDGSSDDDDNGSGETTKVEVEITRTANEELCTVKIEVRSPPAAAASPCNRTDVVVRTLQCLKEQIGDGVSLVAMSTSGGAEPAATGVKNAFPRAVLTMQIKSPGTDWEEQPVKDAVAKVVADALTTTTTPPLPPAAATTVPPAASPGLLINDSSSANNSLTIRPAIMK